MKKLISEIEKLDILKKVLSSQEFHQSIRTKELLKYLVDASERENELNEMTIATEFFGKDSEFNPLEDATIRVNISKVRRRLRNYFLSEGKNEKVIIDIPKGHYVVRFRKRNENYFDFLRNNSTKIAFSIIILSLSIFAIYLGIQNHYLSEKIQVMPSDNPIWIEFLEDSKPTLVILGDYFFMYIDRPRPNPRFNVRDPRINSMEDFQEYSKKGLNKVDNLKPLRHTYLRPSAVWGFMDIVPILRSSKSSFLVKQASEIDWEDISSHNVIFIGTYKQFFLMKKLLKNIKVEFSIYPNILSLYNGNGEEVQRFISTLNDETRQYDDVSLIAKFKGPNNNTIMLVAGFQEGGVIYGSKAISNPDFIKKIQNEYTFELNEPFYFRSVLRVEGFLRSELSSKLEYFEILE